MNIEDTTTCCVQITWLITYITGNSNLQVRHSQLSRLHNFFSRWSHSLFTPTNHWHVVAKTKRQKCANIKPTTSCDTKLTFCVLNFIISSPLCCYLCFCLPITIIVLLLSSCCGGSCLLCLFLSRGNGLRKETCRNWVQWLTTIKWNLNYYTNIIYIRA